MTNAKCTHEFVPHAIEALLDLIPPALLSEAIKYQADAFNEEPWEPRHLNAAEQLCLYVELTYGKQLLKESAQLRNKLDNYQP